MEEHSIFHNRYELEKLLGRGAYSEVWLATDTKTKIQVALKIYAPATGLDDAGLEMFAREFSLVADVSDPNILKPLYFEYDRKPYLVLPYCKAGSIKTKIGKLSEEEAWNVIRDVSKGLKALHSHQPPIIHQDIKPDNIMIADDGHYMISDFGVSTHLHSTLRKSVSSSLTSAGTRAYMAPERFSRHKTPVMASDVYSLGATIYELLTGDAPFGEEGGLLQKSGADIPELEGDYSQELKDLVERCLAVNSWERPSLNELEEYGSAPKKIRTKGEKGNDNKIKAQLPIKSILIITAMAVAGMAIGAILGILL